MKPIKNPFVLTEKVENGFVIVNPLISKGIKLVNKTQLSVLESCDKTRSIQDISTICGVSPADVETVVRILSKREFVSETGVFTRPSLNPPKSMSIWLHSTNRCTLRCSYCHVHKETTDMSFETLRQLGDKIVQSVIRHELELVHLRIAGGEPMLRFDALSKFIPTFRERLARLDCKLRTGFSSNLTILNDDIIQFSKEHSCGFAVSLDGLGDFNDKTRFFEGGKGSFSVVERNLYRLFDQDIFPLIMTVVSDNNLGGLADLTRFIMKHDLKVRYSFVRGCHDMDNRDLIATMLHCYDIIKQYVRRGYTFSKKHRLCDINLFSPTFQVCGAGRNSFSVFTDGSLHLCHTIHDKKIPFGSLESEDDMLSLSVNQDVIPDLHNNNCGGCQYEYICAGGCPIDRINGRSPYCDVFKALIPRVYQLIGLEKLYNFNT